MKLLYSYHNVHNASQQSRWIHFILFIGAFLLVLLALQQLYLYFTAWHVTDETRNWQTLILGCVYLTLAGIFSWFTVRSKYAAKQATDRYVRVTEDQLLWKLTQKEAVQSVPLRSITAIEQPNIRDLILHLSSDEQVTLPIYLIADEGKQKALLAALETALTR